MATDKIVAEYTVKVDLALKNLDALAGRVSKIDQERKKTEDGFKQMSSNLVSDLSKVGAAIGVAFGVQQLVSFTKETVNLAAQAEGVERAFKRIGGGQYLQGLRDATRGTVTDLVLMQNAVKANNFKIPLENLASLFKFAQARARETGESVDYLVDSIILGIGRKSPLILDNLGISAVELRSRLKGVGVEAANVGDIAKIIGDIATEEMAKMGDQADTTADKIAQIGTSFENMKVEIGKSLILLVEDVSKAWDVLVDINAVRAKEASDALTESFKEGQSNAQKTIKNIEGIMKADEGRMKMIQQNMKFIEDAYDAEQKKVKDLQTALDLANIEYGIAAIKKQKQLKAEIQASDELSESYLAQIDVFQTYINISEAKDATTDSAVRSIALLNEQLKTLKEQFDAAEIGSASFYDLASQITAKTKELAEAMLLLLPRDSIALLNAELANLKKELDNAKIAGSNFWKIEDDIVKKTKELNEAIAMTKLSDAFKLDEDIEVKINFDALNDYPEKVKETIDLADQMWQEHFAELMRQQDKAAENREKDKDLALQMTTEVLNTLSSLSSSIASIVQNQVTQDLKQLERQYEAGEITREEFDKKERELQRKAAQSSKDAALFQAVIGTAQAVINALATPNVPFPIAAGFAALAGVVGAIQIAAIATQPLPQFAEGGIVTGKSHKHGGVHIEAEGGEFITSVKQTKKHRDLLDAINKGLADQYIHRNYVMPMLDSAVFDGFGDIGNSAKLNGLTATLKDNNIIAAMDRNRTATTRGLNTLIERIDKLGGNNTRKGW